MASFPNQKKIRIKKNAAGPFLQINLEDLQLAAQSLTYTEFKLYLYLAGNQQNYTFDLSPQDFINKMGVSRSMYNKALPALIEKGYLVLVEGNFYDFYSRPKLS
jgi:DNA-binding MarR family transcriptional regulator